MSKLNKSYVFPFLAMIITLATISACQDCNQRAIEDFNFGWVFKLDDSARYCEVGYDDSDWREIHLPHDWSIECSFNENNKSTFSGGALPGGVGWYRKHFNLKDKAENKLGTIYLLIPFNPFSLQNNEFSFFETIYY